MLCRADRVSCSAREQSGYPHLCGVTQLCSTWHIDKVAHPSPTCRLGPWGSVGLQPSLPLASQHSLTDYISVL